MQFTTATAIIASALAVMASAAGTGDKIISLTTYDGGDSTCTDTNAGSSGIPTDGAVDTCIELAAGTSSVEYYVPCYADGLNGYTLELYSAASCSGAPELTHTITNCDTACAPAPAAGWASWKVVSN